MNEGKFLIGKSFVLGILLGIAFIVSAYILAGGFGKMADNFDTIAKPDRVVTVRGLAEREVDANLAIWPLSFSLTGNELVSVREELTDKNKVVVEFLKKHGLDESDFTVQAPSIEDRELYSNSGGAKFLYRYFARQTILVRSSKVAAVKQAQLASLELTSGGIAAAQDYDGKVRYEYTLLNDIKPQMIGEATKNARAAAEKFASDSKSAVGKIKTATQGWFSINNAANGLEEKKNVRVVTTVEFFLVD